MISGLNQTQTQRLSQWYDRGLTEYCALRNEQERRKRGGRITVCDKIVKWLDAIYGSSLEQPQDLKRIALSLQHPHCVRVSMCCSVLPVRLTMFYMC